MNRRIIARKLFYTALAGAVIFLSLLPSLGWIWHSVLPEHQHIYGGTQREDYRVPQAFTASDCAECAAGETTLHLPGLGAFQIAAVALCINLAFYLPIPNEIITRVFVPSLDLATPFIPRHVPPPKSI